MSRVPVVTGATRGIGREVARQLAARGDQVVLGARSAADGDRVASELASQGHLVDPRHHDVAKTLSVQRLAEDLARDYGAVDLLVNNAAIDYDAGARASTADLDDVRRTLETNLVGAWQVILALFPLLRSSKAGRIVNVSSEAGSLANMGGEAPAYSTSKTALNALTRMLAADLRADHILVTAVCPGWVGAAGPHPAGPTTRQGPSGHAAARLGRGAPNHQTLVAPRPRQTTHRTRHAGWCPI